MKKFPDILKELMKDNNVDAKSLTEYLGFKGTTTVYDWLKGKKGMLLPTAVKLADYFGCSLDYLFGRCEILGEYQYKECPPFDLQLKKVFRDLQISQYKIVKDKIISGGNIDNWFHKKQSPAMASVIKIADYLQVGLDYLVGREA